jgi:hypothetical protein
VSTGAFEISVDNMPVWSKLESGRIPQPPELFQVSILRSSDDKVFGQFLSLIQKPWTKMALILADKILKFMLYTKKHISTLRTKSFRPIFYL